FQTLGKKGFVRSYRGPDGGFALAKPAGEISVLDAIEAMEGPVFLNECLIHVGFCDRDQTCPIHDVWVGAQKTLKDFLSSCTFEKLAVDGKLKKAVLAEGAKGIANDSN
ncbi:MAG: Rrf2 family transcriptional regulator, partial [Thermodesulfobacteriota bacterium]